MQPPITSGDLWSRIQHSSRTSTLNSKAELLVLLTVSIPACKVDDDSSQLNCVCRIPHIFDQSAAVGEIIDRCTAPSADNSEGAAAEIDFLEGGPTGFYS